MTKTWAHKGLRKFYETGSRAGIQSKHASVLQLLLFQLTNAMCAEDMDTPGNSFHQLAGRLKNYYAVKVSANWRLIFQFERTNAFNVDLVDYH
ncbi:MAG: protein killer protein [marine bacterium B5-7]|nr:MAG: protein killer protein [marine bacterium B5-7]